ncbi:MAG: hypothetical protein RML95_00475 [Anaerolineae bacterium]|nr:hypothetical protein [Anaerolineae bacterium]MDW8297791.1 hypothetical protein [Anaerolineae bacterium]
MSYSLNLQDYVSFDIQASPTEILVPDGLSFCWMLNGRAMAFVAINATRQVVDSWLDKMDELRRSWNSNDPVFMLNSFAAPDCVVTPYSRRRITETLQRALYIRTYSCTIIGRSAMSMPVVLLSNAINTFWHSQYKNYVNMVFYSHDEGVRWIQRRIAENESVHNQTSTQAP